MVKQQKCSPRVRSSVLNCDFVETSGAFASDRTGHVSCVFEHCFPTSSSARYPTSVSFY